MSFGAWACDHNGDTRKLIPLEMIVISLYHFCAFLNSESFGVRPQFFNQKCAKYCSDPKTTTVVLK